MTYIPDVRIDVYGKGKTTIINDIVKALIKSGNYSAFDIILRKDHRPKGPEQIIIRREAKAEP